jgi:signal transduction histidine kinase
VAKQMVEAQGGRVWAESPGVGKGSTFFIELPKI